MIQKNFLKRIEVSIIVVILIIGFFFIHSNTAVCEEGSSSEFSFSTNKIVMHLTFSPPTITQENCSSFCIVGMDGLPEIKNDIVPILPVKPIRVLLPQKHILDSVVATYADEVILGENFTVQLGEIPIPIESSPSEKYNQSTVHFNTSLSYPTEICQVVDVAYFRGYSIAILNIFPVQYLATTGQISYYPEITVTISTSSTDSINPLFRGLPIDKKALLQKVDEASMLSTYNFHPLDHGHSSLVDPSETYDYVIITSRELLNAQGGNSFQEFMNNKNEQGTRTTMIAVEDILDDPFYRNDSNHLFNDSQARIRSFIQDAYLNWGIEYILLGGDIDIIPVRGMYFTATGIDLLGASDSYYACLDGSFNSDWNVEWGKKYDGWDIPGSVNGLLDIYAEIYIGRTCVENIAEMSNFVSKTLAYEQSTDSSLQKVLLAGEDGWGDSSMEKLIDGESPGYTGIPHEYNFSKLYDKNQGWPNNDWPKTELINRINNETHLLNHAGHSNQFMNMKINLSDVLNLQNGHPFFAYSQGCLAGAFDNPTGDCIAEYFTVKTVHGAFAGVWNSRYGYEGSSGIFQKEFWDAIYGESMNYRQLREIGPANQDSKEDAMAYTGDIYVYLETNLFGDPQVAIKPAAVPMHDLSVEKIIAPEFRTEHIPVDVPIVINAIVANVGCSNETGVQVHLLIDGVITDTVVTDIVLQRATIVSFNQTFTSGKHNISIVIEGVPAETIVNNNMVYYFVIAGPDTAVVNLYIKLPFYVSCMHQIIGSIMNNGLSPISDVTVKLVVNDEVIQEEYLFSLDSGQTRDVSFFWTPQQTAWYNITIVVDPVANEGYLDNNLYTREVYSTDHSVTVASTGSADFRSIQDAIDWSGDNDTITIMPGTYIENVRIDKSITVQGYNKNTTILEGNNSNQNVIIITADNVTLSGLTLQYSAGTGLEISSKNNKIQGNTIKGKNTSARLSKGVYIAPTGENNNISNNIIENITATGIHIAGVKNIISGNTIIDVNQNYFEPTQPYAAIGIKGEKNCADSNTIMGNSIVNSYNGINVYNTHKLNRICENTLTGNLNGTGIKIGSVFNYVYKNIVSEYKNGVELNKSSTIQNNTFSQNVIQNNINGIIVYSTGTYKTNYNTFIGNAILENEKGICIMKKSLAQAYNNVFFYNVFSENTVFNAFDQGTNIWCDPSIQAGNYWSDFPMNPGYPDSYLILGGNNSDDAPLPSPFSLADLQPGKPAAPCGQSIITIGDSFVFTTSAIDPEDDDLWFLFDWGDGTNSGWLGPYESGSIVTASHIWNMHGVFSLQVTAKDSLGLHSDWSETSLVRTMNRSPNTPSTPIGPAPAEKDLKQIYNASTTDPDADKVCYWFEWGDGTCSGWTMPSASGSIVSLSYIWHTKGTYPVTVKVKDDYGGETTWSNPLMVMVKDRPNKPERPVGPAAPHWGELCTYSSHTYDKDGDLLKYQWSFNGSQTTWSSDWYYSNQTNQINHIWWDTGNYTVKVRAKDTDNFISDWSDSLPISVPHSHPHSCFLAGTKIAMADGSYKSIEDVTVGDLVKSYDTANKKSVDVKVTKTYQHTPDEMGDFYLVINNDLKVTPNHPLFIDDKWTYAGDVIIGNHLVDLSDSKMVITSIDKVFQRVPTYNFEVEMIETSEKNIAGTYIAGGIIVSSQKNIVLQGVLR